MEENKYKLVHGVAPMKEVAVHRFKSMVHESRTNAKEAKEAIKPLWQQVRGKNATDSLRAVHAIVGLVEEGVLGLDATLATFQAMASQVKHPQGLVYAIGELLVLQVKVEPQNCKYGIASRPHPYVSLLRAFPTCWPHVFGYVENALQVQGDDDSTRVESLLELFKPLILFVFANPHTLSRPMFSGFRSAFLNLMRELKQRCSQRVQPVLDKLLWSLVTWNVYTDPAGLFESMQLLQTVFQLSHVDVNVQVLLITNLAVYSAKLGMSPVSLLQKVEEIIAVQDVEPVTLNMALILLSQIIHLVPSYVHSAMIRLAEKLAKDGAVLNLAVALFMHKIFQFLASTKKISQETYALLNKLLRFVKQNRPNLPSSPKCSIEPAMFDANIGHVFRNFQLLHSLDCNEDGQISWLESFCEAGFPQLYDGKDVILSIIFMAREETTLSKAIDVLLQFADKDSTVYQRLLPLVMRRLSEKDLSPDVYHQLLQILPTMGQDKCCLSLVLQVINSLSSRPALQPLRLHLLYKLWLVEERIYPYLQRALEESKLNTVDFNLAKAQVIYSVCKGEKGKQRGVDLVAIISDILNRCKGDEETEIAALALKGITHLIKESVIDVKTTVEVLGPSLSQEHRLPVRIEFAKVLALVAAFDIQHDDYAAFRERTLRQLLEEAYELPERQPESLREANFKAISAFQATDFSLKILPEYSKMHLKFPIGYTAPEVTNGLPLKPEDVLSHIPGDVWTSLVFNAPCEEYAEGFEHLLKCLLSREVMNLPRAAYYLSEAMKHRQEEPPNYNHLKDTSVLRALMQLFQSILGDKVEVSQDRLLILLRVFCQPLERPLPPLNWTPLLRGLILDGRVRCSEGRRLCYKLCVAQSESSRSAQRFLESAMAQSNNCPLLSREIYSNLAAVGHMSNTIKPYLVSTLREKVEQVIAGFEQNDGGISFKEAVQSIHQSVQAAGGRFRSALEDVIEIIYEDIPEGVPGLSEMSVSIIKAVTELPLDRLKDLTDLSRAHTEAAWMRCIALRQHLASTHNNTEFSSHINWLNEVIECALKRTELEQRAATKALFHAFSMQRVHRESTRQWLLELMGQLRSTWKMANTSESDLAYMFQIFAMAVALYSGLDALIHPRGKLYDQLPQSSYHLDVLPFALAGASDLGPQLAEWLMSLCQACGEQNKEKFVQAAAPPPGYILKDKKEPTSWEKCLEAIKKGLVMFKDCEKYEEATMWGRLILFQN